MIRGNEFFCRLWGTYRWDENPWIVDDKGMMLSTKKYPLLHACRLADLHIQRVSTLDYRIRLPRTEHNTHHTVSKLGQWATAILMASPSLHVDEVMHIPAQLTLRNGPEALNKYTWTYVRPGVTHGCHQAHASRYRPTEFTGSSIHMSGVPESEQQELVNLQQRTRNTALVFAAHPKLHGFPWSLPPSINNMHAFKALQRQPFHRAKRKLYPALTAESPGYNFETAPKTAITF